MPTTYTCAACKRAVIVLGDGQIVRMCPNGPGEDCKETVIAEMTATATGEGGVKDAISERE